MESYYISLPIQVSLSTADEEIYKYCPDTDHTEIFLNGQFKLELHQHWSPLGVSFEFLPSIPVTFTWESPRGLNSFRVFQASTKQI